MFFWQPDEKKAMKITQTLIVVKPNIPASITFRVVVVTYFFLIVDMVVLTLMKKDPSSPPMIPSTIGP